MKKIFLFTLMIFTSIGNIYGSSDISRDAAIMQCI